MSAASSVGTPTDVNFLTALLHALSARAAISDVEQCETPVRFGHDGGGCSLQEVVTLRGGEEEDERGRKRTKGGGRGRKGEEEDERGRKRTKGGEGVEVAGEVKRGDVIRLRNACLRLSLYD
jgi:hypothetical protein